MTKSIVGHIVCDFFVYSYFVLFVYRVWIDKLFSTNCFSKSGRNRILLVTRKMSLNVYYPFFLLHIFYLSFCLETWKILIQKYITVTLFPLIFPHFSLSLTQMQTQSSNWSPDKPRPMHKNTFSSISLTLDKSLFAIERRAY